MSVHMTAARVKSLGYVKLNDTSASTLEAVAKSRKSLNTSNGLALLLVFHEMVGVEGFEPTFDAISRTSYESRVYKTPSLHSY